MTRVRGLLQPALAGQQRRFYALPARVQHDMAARATHLALVDGHPTDTAWERAIRAAEGLARMKTRRAWL